MKVVYYDCLQPPFDEIFWSAIQRQVACPLRVRARPGKAITNFEGDAFIISGSQSSVSRGWLVTFSPLLDVRKPGIGICFGHQLMACLDGGCLSSFRSKHVYIRDELWALDGQSFYKGSAYYSHQEYVSVPGTTSYSINNNNFVLAYPERGWFGLQCHPEIDDACAKDVAFHWFGAKNAPNTIGNKFLPSLLENLPSLVSKIELLEVNSGPRRA